MWLGARSLCMRMITSRGDDCPYEPYLLGSPGSPARSRSSATAWCGNTHVLPVLTVLPQGTGSTSASVTNVLVPLLARPEASTGTRGSPYDDELGPSSTFTAWGPAAPHPASTIQNYSRTCRFLARNGRLL